MLSGNGKQAGVTLIEEGEGEEFIDIDSQIKARLQYSKAILIHFMSNVWLRAHFPPKKTLVKNQHFCHKKADFTLFHGFSASQPSWSAIYEQNITLQLRRNSGEPGLVAQIHQNTPKIGCFWAFSHFFFFEVPFLGTLSPKSAFSFIKCGIKYPKWLIYATSIHKTELSNFQITKNESTVGGGGGSFPCSKVML